MINRHAHRLELALKLGWWALILAAVYLEAGENGVVFGLVALLFAEVGSRLLK